MHYTMFKQILCLLIYVTTVGSSGGGDEGGHSKDSAGHGGEKGNIIYFR